MTSPAPFPEGYHELYTMLANGTEAKVNAGVDTEQAAAIEADLSLSQCLFRGRYLDNHSVIEYGRLFTRVMRDITSPDAVFDTIRPEDFESQIV